MAFNLDCGLKRKGHELFLLASEYIVSFVKIKAHTACRLGTLGVASITKDFFEYFFMKTKVFLTIHIKLRRKKTVREQINTHIVPVRRAALGSRGTGTVGTPPIRGRGDKQRRGVARLQAGGRRGEGRGDQI